MRIIHTRRGHFIERPNRWGTAAGAVALGVAWFVACVPPMPSGRWWGFILVATLVLLCGSITLAVL
ncbi:hypothetical protein [Demequina sp.]|uniref:hypothetical protein n=1 Tax=Demequina sp. TaxID=2050685 RepID=UPI003A836357